jgi:hypothetical protein
MECRKKERETGTTDGGLDAVERERDGMCANSYALFCAAKLPASEDAEPSPLSQTPTTSSKRLEMSSAHSVRAPGFGASEPGVSGFEQAGETSGTTSVGAFSEYPKKAAAAGGAGKKMKISLKKR